MSADPARREALMRLGAAGAEAVAQVLDMFAPGTVARGEVSVVADGAAPFADVPAGSVAASVSYVGGVTGANVFVLPPAGVRKLAQGMGMPAPDGEDCELSDLEMSAVGEAANQMMAAAASAIGVVIGQEIEISVPDIRVLDDPSAAQEIYGTSPHATSATFLIGGEPCRLICLVPSAFLVRISRALDELPLEGAGAAAQGEQPDHDSQTRALADALADIELRVWAELGRARLELGSALTLPFGCVVELDRPAEAPVDLFVNGVPFAQGRLFVTDDGEWAFRCETIGRFDTGTLSTSSAASRIQSTLQEGAPI
ncbi:MAG TPA: FliM/FliN family flagellar motor switch protein [Solirubrobacteraceae bacterium]|nr:FliM/FliN family flagellar motor switch protein [Solirubrobacteraceae bacterium]